MKARRGRPPYVASPPPASSSPSKSPVKKNPTPKESIEIQETDNNQANGLGDKAIEETLISAKQSHEGSKSISENPKLWVYVLSENRNPSKGLSMQYVTPNLINGVVEIKIEEEDIATEIKFWDSALVMYAMGEELSMNMVKFFMMKTWNFVKLPEMYYHDDGYFILRFHSHKDMDAVLVKGPYSIRNVPLMLKEWKPGFNLKRDMLRTLPLWVKLPQLPLHLWGAKSLSKIGSAIGVPLVTDECTTSKLRISYARILVEVDVTKELTTEIAIKDCEGRKLIQNVEYEWKPLFYDNCQRIGHKCRESKQWKPKVKPPDQGSKVQDKGEVSVVQPEQDKAASEAQWIQVSSATRDRGKHLLIGSSSGINCENGFEALGVLHDPIVTLDRGP